VDHHNHQGFQEALPYITEGVRSKYSFNPIFDLGCNLKIFRTIGAEQRFKFEGGKRTEHVSMRHGMPIIERLKQHTVVLYTNYFKSRFLPASDNR
jgi:hypothetical protein